MGLFSQTAASDTLEGLLEQERIAVLSGQFDVLERLYKDKERLLLAASKESIDEERLDRLRSAAERNGRLLDAMRSGITSARRRIENLRGTGGAALQTYDRNGQKRAIRHLPQQSGHLA